MGLGALQPGHLIVVLVIVLLIFGPGKLPELGKSLGEGMRELKKATSGNDKDKDAAPAAASTAPAAPSTAPVVTSRVCPSCQNAIASTDKFCGHCGAALAPTARAM
jgi:sec-independent protein translocase protein TatA